MVRFCKFPLLFTETEKNVKKKTARKIDFWLVAPGICRREPLISFLEVILKCFFVIMIIGKKVEVSLRLFDIFVRNMVLIFLCKSFGTHAAECGLQARVTISGKIVIDRL